MPYTPTIHHRRSIRLKGYDYSQAGMYFVTICCQNMICRFGRIENGEMILNAAGEIVRNEWIKSAEIRKEIEIHEYIVMPNHFHAIVEIVGTYGIRPKNDNATTVGTYGIRPPNNDETTVGANGIRPNNADNKSVCHTPLRSPSKTLGALVRGFKSSVTKQLGFSVWQRNYWENIIRNDKSYQYIANYIINNPVKWGNDRFYTK
ncbi:MAG: transposase [Bacteroidales bacterium]|nr:transposase [Bacteroidales bacterium]